MKNKEQLPLNLDRGPMLRRVDSEPRTNSTAAEGVLRAEPTGPARSDQRALNESEPNASATDNSEAGNFESDNLMEQIIANSNLERAWRKVKKNRGAPGPDGITIKELTGRSRGISMKRRLTDLRYYVRGWIGYFGLARQVEDFIKLDGWIRRRVRMCYWKQWRYPRTKVRKLTALGVSLDMAIKHAVSRKSYWRMSRTPAMRYAMPNKWLQEQGLLSLPQL